jgi:hypothetical protein
VPGRWISTLKATAMKHGLRKAHSDGAGSGFGDDPVNCGLGCGLAYGVDFPASPRKQMVGATGFEPVTSTV